MLSQFSKNRLCIVGVLVLADKFLAFVGLEILEEDVVHESLLLGE